MGQWSATTPNQKKTENPLQHGELCANHCPSMIHRFFQLECKYVSYIVAAEQYDLTILRIKIKAKFDGTSQRSINDWITRLAKGGGPKKRFQYCLNPNSSKHFLYFRTIQGHSGGNLIDHHCKAMYCYPMTFAEYIYHVGNVSAIHSIIRSGLIPGGKSLKRDRQSVFFTAVNPNGR